MKKEIVIGLLIALVVAVALAPFASSSPDGLEKVAKDKGFLKKGEGQEVIKSLIPDYKMPGIGNKTFAGIAAGVAGTMITFIAMFGIAKLISIFRKKEDIILKE